MTNELPLVKLGVSIVAGIPVSKIVNDIIKNNVTIVTKADQVKVVAGGLVISTMVAQTLSSTTDKLVDNAIHAYNKVKNQEVAEETTEEVVEETTA